MAALRIDIFEYKIGEMTEQTSQSRPDSTKLTRQYRLGMTGRYRTHMAEYTREDRHDMTEHL